MSSYPSRGLSQAGEGSIRSEDSPGHEAQQQSAGSSRRRASRAGTRSVNTLSATQLERKRANDREAQRAIRQRTKDHIESLERQITELTATQDAREHLMTATQHRNRELEEEIAYLKSRLGGDSSFMLHVTGGEGSLSTRHVIYVFYLTVA